jgi:tetratricopeptide (TPR) repeat protein
MKSILTGICCCLLFCNSLLAAAVPQQQVFSNANDLFRQKQYSDAAAAYQQLIDEGYHQPELYVNAGNAWYKANHTGLAIYNYEKALVRDPFNKQAAHNLSVANQRVEGYVNDIPLLFFQQWWLQIQHLYTPNGWATGSIIFFWLLMAGIIMMLLRPSLKPGLIKWVNTVSGVLFLFFISMAVSAFMNTSVHDTGIVMSTAVKVKAAPDQGSKDIFELHEGVKVQVTDATQEYCKVVLPDGKTGWLACGEIKRL